MQQPPQFNRQVTGKPHRTTLVPHVSISGGPSPKGVASLRTARDKMYQNVIDPWMLGSALTGAKRREFSGMIHNSYQ